MYSQVWWEVLQNMCLCDYVHDKIIVAILYNSFQDFRYVKKCIKFYWNLFDVISLCHILREIKSYFDLKYAACFISRSLVLKRFGEVFYEHKMVCDYTLVLFCLMIPLSCSDTILYEYSMNLIISIRLIVTWYNIN